MRRRARYELRALVTNVPLMLGALGILAIAVMALFGPDLAPHDPQAQRRVMFYPDGSFKAPPIPPDAVFPLGADPIGRDLLSRLLWGARLTLAATLLGLAGRGAIGLTLGLVAGWRRGAVDGAIGYVTNAVGAFPQLMLALLLVVIFREHGLIGFVLALALTGWAELAQFVRAEVLRIRAAAFVESARALGARSSHVVRRHVVRALAPQLIGLLALEAGAVLLLLAELGFIGFFVAGGIVFVDDAGRPVLPVRDRAPEWGQMLAGARTYAFQHQYVAFVPAVVVALAVFAFNLFAEGLRSASDPRSPRRLSPGSLAVLGRGSLALALVGVIAFGVVTVRSGQLTFDDGLAIATDAARRVEPGAELIAAVARFRSDAHALSRPEKLNYYFRAGERGDLLRVGFLGADANAMDVLRFDRDDDLDFESLGPVGDRAVSWEQALQFAEERGGRAFRIRGDQYVVEVILQQPSGIGTPIYTVEYARLVGEPQITVAVNAVDTAAPIPPELQAREAELDARAELNAAVHLLRQTAFWSGPPGTVIFGTSGQLAAGIDRASSVNYTFASATPGDPRVVELRYSGPGGLTPAVQSHPPTQLRPLPRTYDLQALVRAIEDAGGRELRDAWERDGKHWRVNLTLEQEEESTLLGSARYWEITSVGGVTVGAAFTIDPETGEVERVTGR
ncbi:MAG: ABC transporter permease subunit [Candidatus Limnocylindria bacterium]